MWQVTQRGCAVSLEILRTQLDVALCPTALLRDGLDCPISRAESLSLPERLPSSLNNPCGQCSPPQGAGCQRASFRSGILQSPQNMEPAKPRTSPFSTAALASKVINVMSTGLISGDYVL